MFSLKITILGSGNLAHHLCQAFKAQNINVNQLYSRNIEKGNYLADQVGANFVSEVKDLNYSSDLYLFAVSDNALSNILEQHNWNNKLLVHSAGSMSINVFEKHTNHCGVIYPLQSFSTYRALNYKEIPFCIEAKNNDDLAILRKLTETISSNIYIMNTEQRLRLHLSAVFVSNFVNHLFSIAKELGTEKKIPFEIYQPLINETIAKALESNPINAQTGPARRKDIPILDKHIKLLEAHPDWQKIYTFVSQSIIEMYK